MITTPLPKGINKMSTLEIILYIVIGALTLFFVIKTIVKARKIKKLKQEGKNILANKEIEEQEKE